MDRTQSKTLAALWMAGWLTLMLIIAIAGREAAREINVFQLSEMRSILGFLMLYPLIRAKGGFDAMETSDCRCTLRAISFTTVRDLAGSLR
jgi:hypothetical protein